MSFDPIRGKGIFRVEALQALRLGEKRTRAQLATTPAWVLKLFWGVVLGALVALGCGVHWFSGIIQLRAPL